MINFNRVLIAVTTGLFLLAAAVSYARADECKVANFTTSVTEIQDRKGTVTEITGKLRETLEAQIGQPPGIEGEYRLARLDLEGMSLLVVVQGDCINLTAGPFPAFQMDRLLGVTSANG